MRLCVRLGILYVLFGLGVFFFQGSILYLPDRTVAFTPEAIGMAFEELRLVASDGVRVAAWYVPRDDAVGSVIVFHGTGGNLGDQLAKIREFHGFGYHVLAVDYRGYGLSEGRPSEPGTYLDAEAAWAHLVDARGESPGRIVVFGESLGGGVAIELARRHEPGLLMVECTFTSIADVAQRMLWMLPMRLIVRHRYSSIEKVGAIGCPKLFIHGREDEVVPFSLGRRLFEAAAPPKLFIETGGQHNDGGFLYDRETTRRVREAMESLRPGGS